jgi:hypothetical protein
MNGESRLNSMTRFDSRRSDGLQRGLCVAVVVFALVVCAASPLTAQTKSNLASSVTSESTTHVWVARDRGLCKKYGLLTQLNPKIAEVRVDTLIDVSFMNNLESSGFIQGLYKKH